LDATGAAAEKAAKQNAAELRKRQDEISISRKQEEAELSTNVYDPKRPDQPILIDEIEEVGVSVNNDKVVIRTITDIEEMTYGVGNHYTFKAGVKYSVPRDLANYLESIGYVWSPGS
jgi:hypothetical protein